MTSRNAMHKLSIFNAWLDAQPAQHRVVVAGNHDQILESVGAEAAQRLLPNAIYLCNSGVELEGLRLWGTPISDGRSPNRAFQSAAARAAAAAAAASLPPGSVDLLITHGFEADLARAVAPRSAHVYGHLHCSHGVRPGGRGSERWLEVCGPVMSARLLPYQHPIVLDVPRPVRDAPSSLPGHGAAARRGSRVAMAGAAAAPAQIIYM